MQMLAGAFTIGAATANSPIDQSIYNLYQEKVRSSFTNDLVDIWRPMGQNLFLYIEIGIGAIATLAPNTKVGDFSKKFFFNSLRAFTVGTAQLHIMKAVTGGARPTNTTHSSYWKPFTLKHGVSGDTYTGAIPFITLAKMTENPYLKTFFYGVSTFAGIGRLNDGCHYPSQVFLGWMMAYAACESVCRSNSKYNLSFIGNQVAFDFEY